MEVLLSVAVILVSALFVPISEYVDAKTAHLSNWKRALARLVTVLAGAATSVALSAILLRITF